MHRTVIAGSIVAFATAVIATAVLLPSALPASGGPDASPRETPAAFLTRIVGLIVSDHYAQAWTSLYPMHQEVAPRSEYVACELKTPVGWKLRSADVVRVVDKLRRIPGDTSKLAVAAVTLRLRIANPSLQTEGGFTHTFTAVAVGDRWTWVLTPSKYRLYRTDAC